MPIEIEIEFENIKLKSTLINLKKKHNVFKIKVDAEPKNINIDPNLWVLMNVNFEQKID